MTGRARLSVVFAAILGGSTAAQARHLGGAADTDVSLIRVFLALFLCLILAGLAAFLIRQRWGGKLPAVFTRARSSSSRIQLAESRRIGPQTELCLVECDGHEYLLLISAGGPLLLREAPRASGTEH